MQRKFRNRNSQRTRIGLRTVLYASTFLAVAAIAVSVFFIQLFKETPGSAATNPMVIARIEVTQDTMSLYRGTNRQLMLRINIITSGNSNKLNFNSITLAARGSSKDAYELISNARLWYTGNESYFTPVKQIGSTVVNISKENFEITDIKSLSEGSNYFWLTYDISDNPRKGDLFADAECISVRIGTLVYDPPVAAPPGSRKILPNKPYYSSGNGDISSLKSWNTHRDGSGMPPQNFSELSASFIIQPGHIMRNELSACVPVIMIENGGVLNSNSDIKANLLEIFVGGNYIQNKAFSSNRNIGQLVIQNHGNYIHSNKGLLAGKRRTIGTNSNIIISDCSDETFSEQIEWGNLIIDYKENVKINFGSALHFINGDLEIRNTGTSGVFYTNSNDTIIIKGDLIVNNGTLELCHNENSIYLDVLNKISIKGGVFADQISSKNNKGNLTLNCGTAMYIMKGEFQINGKYSTLIFDERNTDWLQKNEAQVTLPDMVIKKGARLTLKSDQLAGISVNRKLLVENGGLIQCNTGIIKGEGAFEVTPGGVISTAHPEGIYSSGDTGCIRTAERIYSQEMSVIYTGSSSPQYSGVFTTGDGNTTVKTFTLSKAAITNVVVLNQDITITGTFYHQRGNLNKNSFNLNKGNINNSAMLSP